MKSNKFLAWPLMVWLAVAAAQAQTSLGTVFTYQGRLTESGGPADGLYDFEFRLYGAATGGSPISGTVALDNQPVSDGLFTVELDFGGAFAGDGRWLEIAVRPGTSGGGFTVLTPRQKLTPAPYTLFALGTPWSGLSGVPVGFADGVDNVGGLTLPYAGGIASSGTAFSVTNTGSAGTTLGVEGVTASPAPNAAGVRGSATAGGLFDGPTYGVDGTTAAGGNGSAGVRGVASNIDMLAGATFGVDGETKSGALDAAGVRGRATGNALGGATFGVDGSTSSFANGAAGVRGTTAIAGAGGTAGVWGRDSGGAGDTFGVVGQSTSTDSRAAGVRALGNGTSGPGAPQAAALEINNGAIRVTGTTKAAGTLSVAGGAWTDLTSFSGVGEPPGSVTCFGGYRTVTLSNTLITPQSIILLTVDASPHASYPGSTYGAQVVSKVNGSATLRVAIYGGPAAGAADMYGPPLPGGALKVNYLIINP